MSQINISESLLERIKDLVELYNQLPDVEKIAIMPEKYTKTMNIPHSRDNRVVAENMYVCRFNQEEVGIFKKEYKEINPRSTTSISRQGFYDIYRQYKGDLIGLYIYKAVGDFSETNKFANIGMHGDLNVSCRISEAITYDTMRTIMYEHGELDQVKFGETTESEMLKVISFARNYYKEKANDKKAEKQLLKDKKN